MSRALLVCVSVSQSNTAKVAEACTTPTPMTSTWNARDGSPDKSLPGSNQVAERGTRTAAENLDHRAISVPVSLGMSVRPWWLGPARGVSG